ncbi:hypothetical protein LCGC14_0498610 [marine sediment metagenome]|uniref:DNA helicase DnaB-like N-terminal domain-containing protein n=1 Tax=marine sediment metagenome TaxID=412755 RepID=A0A0F9SN13_9ZZZZ
MPEEKLPPHDTQAESAILGSIMLFATGNREEMAEQMAGIVELKPSDFFRDKNGWIYEGILALSLQGTPPDQLILAHWLAVHDKLEAVGGPAYLIHCLAAVATCYHLKHYAGIVKDCADRRQAISRGQQMVRQAYEGGPPSPSQPTLPGYKKAGNA